MKNHNKQKGFALVFVIAVVAALSLMTGSMFFYYDTDLKSVSRNSVMQQVNLAAETGLQEGQRWITEQLNSNSFALVDIQNDISIEDSNNQCLNRHGYTNTDQDVYYAQRIQGSLGDDEAKFEDMSYEVFVMRHADVVKSIYFEGVEARNSSVGTNYQDRSFALVEQFNDFPTEQFTIEMWIKNMKDLDDSDYNMHAFEWGREWDLVFKVLDDRWSPRLGEKVLGGSGTVGTPIKQEWAHIAWVWDGGTPGSTDTGNVRIYQNGVLVGTYNADIGARSKSGYTNPPEILPEGDLWPLAIGEGLHGFTQNSYLNGVVKIQGVPWKGNIAEMRIWDISRTGDDIANNNRRRLTGSEPGLVSYYKFNEGTGNIAKDFNTSRTADKRNDATIYGIGNKGTLWKTELAKYPVTSDDDDPPSINVPPGEDIVYYKILSCGEGPDEQIIPLELIVSAPVQKGDVGDGLISLTEEDLNSLSGQEGTPLKVPLNTYIGQDGTAGDINIQTKDNSNTNFYVFKRAMEQCENSTSFTEFSAATAYDEGDCAEFQDKLYYLEKDDGKSAGDDFVEEDWSEVLGSGCDGVQFMTSPNDNSYGHYYKYFSTAPNVTSGDSGDLGYNGDSIDWWEAKRRAEQSTCGGMRGYLVSIESAAENEFIKDAVMCDSSSEAGCDGVTPFHVAAGETRTNYYGTRLNTKSKQHFLWLSNSDWRNPTNNAANMQSESGPLMGMSVSYVNWQNNEPNSSGEPYADMEINRSGRTNGKWNDLRRVPGCTDGGLDCITGYVVEYGGFDHFKLDHDINQDGDTDDTIAGVAEVDFSDHNFCVARATIEKDTYVAPRDLNSDGDTLDQFEREDFLKIDKDAEDYPSSITGVGSQTVDYPGWDADTGVLTLEHSGKPADWSSTANYNADAFVWFNNRVWKNTSGSTITGGANLNLQETPTIFNPQVWTMYEGDEDDAPCANLSVWEQAFESIKYYNSKEIDAEADVNPYAAEGDDGTDGTESDEADESTPSLGERTILFSLGPLHVEEHRDGYNHFYEFYEFPARPGGNNATDNAAQNLYNDKNRRMNEAFSLSRQLEYFGKSGYLATITSESEDDIITEKAVGNGWMGGLGLADDSDSNADLNKCGGFRQRASRAQATADFRALRNFENIPFYRGGQNYGSDVNYLRNIVEKYTAAGKSPRTITGITRANPAVVTTNGNHGLTNDDIIKIADRSSGNQIGLDGGFSQLRTGFYRVRDANNNTFSLVELDTRQNVDTSDTTIFTSAYTANSAELWELEGIQNEFYRKSSNITNANNNPQSQSGLQLFYKDPKIALSNNNPVPQTGTRTKLFFNASFSDVDDSVEDSECPVWRWMTGPEGMLWNGRGLAFAPTRASDQTPSANNGTWTRANPAGQQIGEVFVDNMPYRNWNGTWEPNNVAETEHGIHLLGTHFPDDQELKWNDLHNWSASYSDNFNYSIRGLILEYGGMENDEDPIIRIATKRVIKLFDRRVTKAVVRISDGEQTGDKLVAGTTELTELGITASDNETSTVTLTGDATCQNYLDVIRSMYFEHNASTGGVREISVQLGDVEKPNGAEHYYQLKDGELSYRQADFQSSYQNLCGIQGYLANVTTAADLNAITSLGVDNSKQAWVNGTDECQGGIYRSGFWRYTSGPWKDKEFWRLRLDIPLDNNAQINTNLANQASCGVTDLRDTQPSVRVGPFTAANWISNHPAANTNNFLAFQQTNSPSTTGILTRDGMANSTVEGYIVRFGGSVGDYTGADIEEDGNDINVILGPIRAEVSFFTDGSDNSIYIAGEDSVDVNTSGDNSLSTGWTKTTNFGSTATPTAMVITPPSGEVIEMETWREELAKVFYQNLQTDNFTSGNRKILIRLVYGDTSLNEEIDIVKAIGSRNAVTVTPISWNNR